MVAFRHLAFFNTLFLEEKILYTVLVRDAVLSGKWQEGVSVVHYTFNFDEKHNADLPVAQ